MLNNISILGIDNSTTGIGVSVLSFNTDQNKLYIDATVIMKKNSKESFNRESHPFELYNSIKEYIKDTSFVDPVYKDKQLLIENFFIAGGINNPGALPIMYGFLLAKFHSDFNIIAKQVEAQSWKRKLIGMRTKGKEYVEEYVLRYIDNHNIAVNILHQEKTDAWDAIGISMFPILGTEILPQINPPLI